ncbi:MAG: DUF2752 domain-containing protein [Clostridia bacterium]|nr:DUF2752 domain-containing protein [Clostridia bacterium]
METDRSETGSVQETADSAAVNAASGATENAAEGDAVNAPAVTFVRGRKSLKEIWHLPGGPLFLLICLLFALGVIYAILSAAGIDLYSKLGLTKLKCTFHEITGLYCPGCGGTRSLLRLLHLDIIGSILLHPVPVYLAALCINYVVRFIFAYLVPEKCPIRLKPPKIRLLYAIIFFGLFMTNFIVRNILLACGIPTL